MKLGLFLLIVSSSVLADFAKVKFVRGEVTALKPGENKAVKLKRNDILPEDTSVVTSPKSIIKINLSDGSVVSLGPKSKLVLHTMNKKKKTNVMGVLKGVIRAEVRKEQVQDPKMIIKTRSAVMGVRGTTFKSVYNPATNNTSLVTIEGEVAMAKVEEVKPSEVIAKKKEIIKKAKETGDVEKIKEAQKQAEKMVQEVATKKPDAVELKEALKSKEVVSVTKGQFSGVVSNLEKPTIPVKVAPKQLVALAKKDELADKVVEKSEDEIIKEVYTEEEISKQQADKRVNLEKGELAPRSGGLIDFKTGLYVPPPATAKYDEEKHVFVAAEEDVGKVDEAGEYIPPKGIKIDEEKGFVVDTKEIEKIASNEELQRIQSRVGFLNDEVKEQVEKEEEEVQKVTTKKRFWKDWFKVKNHVLNAAFVPKSQSFGLNNKDSGSKSDVFSKSSSDMTLTWTLDWLSKWRTDFNLMASKIELQDPDNVSIQRNYGGNLMSLTIDFNYQYTERLDLVFGLGDQEGLFISPQGPGYLDAFSKNVKYMKFGSAYRFLDYKKFQFFADASISLYSDAEAEDSFYDRAVRDGKALYLGARALYDYKEKYKVEAIVFLDRSEFLIDDFLEQTTTSLGVGANFIWDI